MNVNNVDALFVNPPSPDNFVYIRDINRHGRSSWERMIWPQTNLAYLASVAEKVGMTVDIIDCIAENISWKKYTEILKTKKPRYCFSNIISATFQNDIKALRVAKDLSQSITVGMGPHVTSNPSKTLEEAEGLDFVITHEAEATLEELLKLFERKDHPKLADLEKIKGIGFIPSRILDDNNVTPIITEQRPFIENLDELPMPRHDLLPLKKYWAPFLGNYTFVEASRGCSYRCIFCRQAVMWQWNYRKRSAKSLVEEAIYVHSLGVKSILFHADTFTLDPVFVEDTCDRLIKAGSPFKWACNAHVQNLYSHPKLIKKMKQAGCWMIAVGIESADDTILKNIKKGITSKQAETVIQMINQEGIEAWGYFVLGLPGDTIETMDKTIRFSLNVPLKIAKFDIAAPYPGTEFYNYAKDNGYLKLTKYEDFDQNSSAIVEYPDLSRKEIKKAIRKATVKFYLRPKPLIKIIKELCKISTIKSIFLIIRDFLCLLTRKNC